MSDEISKVDNVSATSNSLPLDFINRTSTVISTETSLEAYANIESNMEADIHLDESKATISYKDLHLNAEAPYTNPVTVTFEKKPLPIVEGNNYDNNQIIFDRESPKMQEIATQAEALKILPENERVKAIMELLRANIQYASNDVVDLVAQTNPDLAKWVATNTGLDASTWNIPLSEVFEKGYAICRHLSVAYLYLAQKAGLEGTLMETGAGIIRNIQRTDTNTPLFKSVDIGQQTAAHVWTELRMSNGNWIPVDPSTRLVGDTQQGLEMFRQANYLAYAGYGFQMGVQPSELTTREEVAPFFKPSEPTAVGKFRMLLKSTQPINTLRGLKPPSNTPYNGDAIFNIASDQSKGVMNLVIKDVK